MKSMWQAGLVAVALVCGQAVMAEEAATPPEAPVAAEAPASDAPVQVTPMGEQVVTVNTGNETVDAAANLAVKCTERAGAMKACDSMGGFKAMGCRKLAEMKYRGVECPLQ